MKGVLGQYISDVRWDRLLKIRTTGRDDSRADDYRYAYEPTPYAVLERLAGSGTIGKKNLLVDYGCGKGRVSLFLSDQTRCRSIGVDFNERILERARRNKEAASCGHLTEFVCGAAERYEVPDEADRFFFFNPFSVKLLRGVTDRLRESYERNPREMLLYFYYPSDEYIAWLMTVERMAFADEIDCRDLFGEDNDRERVLIFTYGS